ncbi:MAG: xanthine dehydrogenase family protein subunit M [Dehalococcoidia bacterium]|nr:xanthine dehydrogenase family protein subunit M [Dehalococcoidia bacterium]
MTPFEILNPSTLGEAYSMLSERDEEASIFAGGTDILGEMKQDTSSPACLVNIASLEELRSVEQRARETAIGSMVTLSRIARDPGINARFPALTQAAESVATPQIRNVGTLGGNLCQRPRCWYYRSPAFDCLKKGGDTCFAVDGGNKYHAILGADRCHIVHPSDTAVALMALDAQVDIFGEGGLRRIPVSELFVGPGEDILSETTLGTGDILTRVAIPHPGLGARSIYLKAKERQAYDFALVSVGGYMEVMDGVVAEARIVLGGVAPVPYFARAASDALRGARASDVDAKVVGQLAVEGAEPMSENGYKVRLASNLVARAVRTLLDMPLDE